MIQLNIGGTLFHTTKDTLHNNGTNFFTSLLTHATPCRDKMYFIDRDPTHFRHILNYLRNTRLPTPFGRGQLSMLTELWLEADFYQITTLSDAIEGAINAEQRRLKQHHHYKKSILNIKNLFESIVDHGSLSCYNVK